MGRDVTERRPRALQRGRGGGEDLHNKESPLIRERHAVIETQKNTRTTHKRLQTDRETEGEKDTERQREGRSKREREREREIKREIRQVRGGPGEEM